MTDSELSSPVPRRRFDSVVARLASLFEVVPIVGFRGLAGGMPILLGLYIGHRWGLVELGAYTLGTAIMSVGLVVTDWGCARWLPRELALANVGSGEREATHTANTLRLALAVTYVAVTAILAAAGVVTAHAAVYACELSALYAIAIVSTNGISDLVVVRKTWRIAAAVAAGLAVFAGICGVAHDTPHAIVAAYVAGKAVEAAVLISGRTSLVLFSARHLRRVALALFPFAVQAVLAVVYSRLAVFVVERLRPMADVGLVGAASALQGVLLLLPASMALLYFPSLSTAAAEGDAAGLRRMIVRAVIGSAAGVTIGFVVVVAARNVFASLLHIPARYISFVIAFVALPYLTIGSTMAGMSLQAAGGERLAAKLSLVTLGASIVAQYALIRQFGVWGVVFGCAAGELLSATLFSFTAARALRRKFAVVRVGDTA